MLLWYYRELKEKIKLAIREDVQREMKDNASEK